MMPSTAATASAVSTVEISMSRRTLAMTRAAPESGGAPCGAGAGSAPGGVPGNSADAGSAPGATALSGAPSGGDVFAPAHAAKSGGNAGAASDPAASGREAAGFPSGANGSSIGEDRISFSLAAASSGVLPSAAAG